MNTFIQDNILQTKYNPPRFFIQFSVKAVLDRTLVSIDVMNQIFKEQQNLFLKKSSNLNNILIWQQRS